MSIVHPHLGADELLIRTCTICKARAITWFTSRQLATCLNISFKRSSNTLGRLHSRGCLMRIRRPRVDRIGAHRGYYYWYKISKKGLDRAQYFSNRRSIPSFNTVAFGRGTLQDLVKLHLSKDLDNKLPNPSDAVLRRGI